MRKLRCILMIFLGLWLLSGCARELTAPTSAPSMVTIRFWKGEELLEAQDVEWGKEPLETAVPEIPGMRFLGWDRPVSAARKNEDYYGVFVPELSRHVPYLFPREDGFLYPNAPFTGSDLASALDALGEEAAKAYYPEFRSGEEGITAGMLWNIMEVFFPDRAAGVFSGSDLQKELTRGEAAVLLNALLGRQGERVSVSESTTGFWDITADLPAYEDLMEAACPHEPGNIPWGEVLLCTGLEPGWVIREGKTMIVDENGYLLRNTVTADGLMLNADGFITSGNTELDALVSDCLAELQEKNPEMDRQELLREAYLHVRDDFFYLRKENLEFGADGWQVDAAIEMLSTGKGNCYNYAAAFWALAQGLGYKAEAVSGTIGQSQDPHGWAELTVDGEIYYCDPESEMVEISWGNNWNFFMLNLYEGSNFNYRCARNVWGG